MNLNLIARLAELTATSHVLDAAFSTLFLIGLIVTVLSLVKSVQSAIKRLFGRDDAEEDKQAELSREPDGSWKAVMLDDPEICGRGVSAVDALADLINGYPEEFGFRVRLFR